MHISNLIEIHRFKRCSFEYCGTLSLKTNDILISNLHRKNFYEYFRIHLQLPLEILRQILPQWWLLHFCQNLTKKFLRFDLLKYQPRGSEKNLNFI
nr:MAG TPA: hypothetical protein [Caudoviricetes sp.]